MTWLPGDRAGYQWAQYVSGVVGLVVLGVWVAAWWRRTPLTGSVAPVLTVRQRCAALGIVVVAGVLVATTTTIRIFASSENPVSTLGFIAVTRGSMAALVVTGVLAVAWRVVRHRSRAPGDR